MTSTSMAADTTAGALHDPSSTGWAARAVAVVRIVVGLFFVSTGLPKFSAHTVWAADFTRWHVPMPELGVYGVGTLEVAGGMALALGIAARPVAALFTASMAGAVLTAGLVDGGQHLVLPPILAVVTAGLALRGAGAWQLYPRRARRP